MLTGQPDISRQLFSFIIDDTAVTWLWVCSGERWIVKLRVKGSLVSYLELNNISRFCIIPKKSKKIGL